MISDKQKGYVVMALQIFLGLVFLFSGFAKVIDPLGGWYKVDDYLTAFSWDMLKDLGFLGSILLTIVFRLFDTMLVHIFYPNPSSCPHPEPDHHEETTCILLSPCL